MTKHPFRTRLIVALALASSAAASACNSGVFDQDVEAVEARISPGCTALCERMEDAGCNSSSQSSCAGTCESRLRAALYAESAGCVQAVEAFLDCCPANRAAACSRDSFARVEDCSCPEASNVGDCASDVH
jgi:hypothetical protein